MNLTKTDIQIIRSNEGEKIENIADLKKLIIIVCGLVGIKDLPDQHTVDNCWNAFDHFRSFTKQNFKEAFEFNEAMVYEERIQHFNSYLPAYQSQVLNLYRGMRNKAIEEYKRALKSNEPKEVDETGEQSYLGLINYVKENNEVPRFWDWNKVFLYMEEASLIQITKAEKIDLYNKVIADIELKKTTATDLDDLKKITLELKETNVIKECRRITVMNELKKLITTTK